MQYSPLQTLQTSKSAEDSLQKELQQVQSKLEEEMAAHKRDNSANSGQVAELEGTVREEREKRERLQQERERETTQLKDSIDRLSKELSDSRVSMQGVFRG
jgi:chromosome segregation ATPase